MTLHERTVHPWLSAVECEQYLGVKANRVRNWHHRGRLGAIAVTSGADRRRWMFLAVEVLRLADGQPVDDSSNSV
ncbi:MAG TPA: hypothetical protein VGP44_13140 [Gemmatimonadales bacterium]|nr:hypothetical protein [Gemmatimonadales bacterium]